MKKIASGCADTQLRLSRSGAATGLANDGSLCLQCAESVILQSDVPSEAAPQLVNITLPQNASAHAHSQIQSSRLDCVAAQNSNAIIKFADDTTVVGLITDNDETTDL